MADAEGIFGASNVTDHLKEIAGAPTAWYESSKLGLEKLKAVEYGEFDIRDREFSFKGYLSDIANANPLEKSMKTALNSDYSGSYNITGPEKVVAVSTALSCQNKFKELLSGQKIHFEYNKANIKRESYRLLNSLIEVSNGCPDDVIVIEGHTDSDGSKAYNQKLSNRRANAVKNYFVKKGVSKRRIEAIGYGEIHPVATNKTKAGKEKNRRIEFKIKGVK